MKWFIAAAAWFAAALIVGAMTGRCMTLMDDPE